jgi:hypothetical protein
VHEGDEPDVVRDLPHPHLLASEDLAQIHLPIREADAAAVGDPGRPIVQRVVEFTEPAVRTGDGVETSAGTRMPSA